MSALIDRFIGHHTCNLDTKNRVIIPSVFRDVLADRYDDRLVLMKDYDHCLVAYPVEEWQKIDEKISALPSSDLMVRRYLRNYYSSAEVCKLDGQGRVLIPQQLKAYAGISREAIIIGLSKRMEIWDLELWRIDNPDEDGGDIRKAMAAFGL